MKVIKIYLASGTELDDDRIEFGNLIRRLDEIYERRGVRIKLIENEADEESVNEEDESGKCIGESDVFLALFHLEAGRYTVEEFNRATEEFKLHSSPKVYAYMKSVETGEEETDELKDFKHHLLEEIGHYWCKYRNTDTMQLHFVMQLQLLESHPSVELKIKDEKALLDGEEVADLSKVPFVSLNKGFQKLKEDIEELDEDMADIRIDLKEDPDNERKKVKLLKKSERRNALAKELEQTQDFLFQTAMKFNSLMGRSCTRRIIKAKELLDEGKAEEANAVLDIGDIDRDAEINIKAYEQAKEDLEAKRENVIKSIEEYTVKASTVMTDSSIPNMSERCDQACDAYKKAIDLGKRVNYDKDKLASILFDYGLLSYEFKRYKECEIIWKDVLILTKSLSTKDNAHLSNFAMNLNNLGVLYGDLHRYEEAEIKHKEALDIRQQLAKIDPLLYLPDLAMSLNNIGVLHKFINLYSESIKEIEESLDIYRDLTGKNSKTFSSNLALSLNNLACLHEELHKYEDSEKEHKESLVIRRSLAAKAPKEFLPDVVMSLINLGNLYVDLQRYEEAKKEYNEALILLNPLVEKNPSAFSPYLAQCLNNFGNLYYYLCHFEDSEKKYKEALVIRRLLVEKDTDAFLPYLVETLNNLGNLHSDLHRYEEAEKEYKESLSLRRALSEKIGEAIYPDIAQSLKNLGDLYSNLQRFEEAEAEYTEYLRVCRVMANKGPDKHSLEEGNGLLYLAVLHHNHKDYDKAEKEYTDALAIYRKFSEGNSETPLSYLAWCLKNLGLLYRSLHNYEETVKAYQESGNIYRSLLGRFGNNYMANLVACLGGLSFYLLFFKRAQESEKKAKEALSMDDSQLWIYTNLISSYVMQNKFEEADNTIPKIQNEKERMNALFSDWNEFEERGLFTDEQKAYIEKKKKEFDEIKEA
jgi:tetratricopeptide (TPR) repeat protein